MNTNDKIVSTSKFLSLILRHEPSKIGLTLDAQGWANIDELISLSQRSGKRINRALIEEVVTTNDKQRFIINDDGRKIRANQGHSVKIDLGLQASVPPDTLYHGTATRFLQSIRTQGLLHGSRQHVHLSAEKATAIKVGSRHGVPTVLIVAARKMHEQGHHFYLSENGVWLTEHVPVSFIEFAS
jgi:putative RNA 2'-phosphotransferase